MAGLDISQLLHSLQGLFYRLSHLNLMSRMNSYQGDVGGGMVKDISAPLNEHLEELAGKNAENNVENGGDVDAPSKEQDEPTSLTASDRSRNKTKSIRGRFNGLSKLFRKRSPSVVIQPHLSEQLQRRVRQHLNTSLRKARQGDITNAKLYADLASNAIHELTKYMPKDEFTRFNTQVCADLKEFRDRDIFKPFSELLQE